MLDTFISFNGHEIQGLYMYSTLINFLKEIELQILIQSPVALQIAKRAQHCFILMHIVPCLSKLKTSADSTVQASCLERSGECIRDIRKELSPSNPPTYDQPDSTVYFL